MPADPGERTHGQWWEADEPLTEVSVAGIRRVTEVALWAAGAAPEDASFLLRSMLEKAAQGDPIRGFGILPTILRGAADASAVLDPEIELTRESPATALIDGPANANGGVVCRRAMKVAITKAEAAGTATVAVRAFHWNLGPLLKMATGRGLVAIIFNSSIPAVAPLGGATPVFGNAPVGFGIPAGAGDPIIVDLSLTNTSSTPVALAALGSDPTLPAGFILDRAGRPSEDARDYLASTELALGDPYEISGSLVPLGGERSAHKGYALLFAVNVLATALAGADPPWTVLAAEPTRLGCQIQVVDPGAFGSREGFARRVEEFVAKARSVPRRPGVKEILFPGEKSQRLQRERLASGAIAIPAGQLEELRRIAAEHGIDPGELDAGEGPA